ncbi:hypothetical protein PsYK624_097130 [Phanerochaete sordida]|uniref:Uncharacterized protein n=1 Tax=Phanerochaete sordida TaxID=48140 RepID=A0A9P3GFV7_9APHY|nr:hypothetical protein PsYK624_097130 [Phanerochaete sordida]
MVDTKYTQEDEKNITLHCGRTEARVRSSVSFGARSLGSWRRRRASKRGDAVERCIQKLKGPLRRATWTQHARLLPSSFALA